MPSSSRVRITSFSGVLVHSEYSLWRARFAVIAHIRHTETGYDNLLAQGMDRAVARLQMQDSIEGILEKWRGQ